MLLTTANDSHRLTILLSFLVFSASAGLPSVAIAQTGSDSGASRFPAVEVAHRFGPPGESNVRSSIRLDDGIALMGTEETGDIFKTTDAGETWTKAIDGKELWDIQDVRNFHRASNGRLYATTSEPALVISSEDEGETWKVLARPAASRTVALTQLDTGEFLVGLRRSENDKISLVRSANDFETTETIVLDDELPRQNTTCLIDLGGGNVLCGIGYEASGKIFRSSDSGKTWSMTAEFPEARDVMNFYTVGEKVFVLTSGIATIFVSEDSGQTWAKHAQIWAKGFLGQHAVLNHGGQTYHLLAATDQREKKKRHVVLISNDGENWEEWIELATDSSGGTSNLAVISDDTIVVGTGNHSVQGFVYTLKVKSEP